MGIIYGKKSPTLYRDFVKCNALNPSENLIYIDSTRISCATAFSENKINYIGHNSIKHSEKFNDPIWIKDLNLVEVVNQNNPLGYKGYYIIYESNPNELSKEHDIHQDIFLEKDKVYNFSIYVKSFGRDNVSLYAKNGNNILARANFIIAGNNEGAYTVDHESMTEDHVNIVKIDQGWWRVGITFFNGIESANGGVYISLKDGANYQYIGDNNSYNGVGIVGAQLTESHYLCGYLKTTASENSGPRINNQGLLIEKESRNLFRSSDRITGYSALGSSNIPFEYKKIDDLSGINNFANLIQFIDDGSILPKTFSFNNINYLQEPRDYTFSLCFKPNGYEHVGIDIWDDINEAPIASAYFNLKDNYLIKGTGLNANITELENEWHQCSISFYFNYSGYSEEYQTYNLSITPYITISTGELIGNIAPYVDLTSPIEGIVDSGMYVAMPQIENGSFATSYIPNYITGLSYRAREEIEILPENIKKFYEQKEGSIYMRLKSKNELTGINTILSIFDIESDSRSILLQKDNQRISAYLNNDNNSQGFVNVTGNINFSESFNILLSFKDNNFHIFMGQSGNVFEDFTSSGIMMNNPTKMNIGFDPRGQNYLNSEIQSLFYYPYFMDRSSAIRLCQT